ncbi:carboxypeptidase regulatory-like domain-containing protein [Pseudenhygromyxa sp. WMMC2535]|uniref:carboxypeptidase-like regulatory domain-containing protein n=1 Tax=Pseudenhygromyxa sp. WMMC2535 TaxID=2712867 RepID=UPI001552B40C|nr:carboxypeptidase-like regulatory domain-containing protein [Pseudenhygromyxa sp. WMMC2535]NVB40652.1 carboxypeptidase regulatory-like domain-containing protein [Pseudenhygromyxa sp. WMMC2535]
MGERESSSSSVIARAWPIWVILALLVLALVLWRQLGGEGSSASSGEDERGVADGLSGLGVDEDGFDAGRDGPAPSQVEVFGKVSDLEGKALADAQVCALISARGSAPRCTRSDVEGRYHLAGMPPGEYQVSATASEHQPSSAEVDLRATAKSELDLELLPGAVLLRGVVHDLAGGEVEGAQIRVRNDFLSGDPIDLGLAVSDAEGRFELWVRRGRVQVSAGAPGYSWRLLHTTAPGASVELYLVPESVLIGRVIDEQGAPMAGIGVQPGSGGGTLEFFVDAAGGYAQTDAKGEFRIAELAPGTYRPFVASGRHRGRAALSVKLGLGETSDPVEIVVGRGAVVQGQVVDEAGEPTCVGERLTLTRLPMSRYHAKVDAKGWVEIGGLAPGDYRPSLSCRGRTITDLDELHIDAGDVGDAGDAGGELEAQRWEVASGYPLSGVVVDAAGDPIPGVVILAERQAEPGERLGRMAARTESEPASKSGAFRFEGLVAGTYELQIGGSSGPALDESIEVELRAPGLEGVRIEAPLPGTLRGRVLDDQGTGVANITVSAYPESGEAREIHSDDAGNFELRGLGPGDCRVIAIDGRWQLEVASGEVEILAGAVAELDLEVPRGQGVIRGRVVDEAGTAIDDAFVSITRQAGPLDKGASPGRLSYADAKGRPVLSDVDGGFEIAGLPEGLYTVFARQKQGGDAAVANLRPGKRSVTLVIPAQASLAGVVALPEDAPRPEGALHFEIVAEHAESGLSYEDAWESAAGLWSLGELPPGHYALRVASAWGDAEREVELAPGQVVEDLRIELAVRVRVRGRVVDGEGAPLAGARLRPLIGGRSFDMGPGYVDWVETGADGRFEVSVAQGKNKLLVTGPSGAGLESVEPAIEVGEGDEQDVGDIALTSL